MSITIEVGSLFKCNVDCIVNFGLNNDSTLNSSALSSFIAEKVGAEMENKIIFYKETLYLPKEFFYQLIITENHLKTNKSLLFDNIIHCYLENYDHTTDMSERIYKNYLKHIFNFANMKQFKSIAIPVYSFNKQYSACYLAQWINEVITNFKLSTTIHSLETIRIVIYRKEENYVIQEFKDFYSKLASPMLNIGQSNEQTVFIDNYQLSYIDSSSEEFRIVTNYFNYSINDATIVRVSV